MNFITMYDCVDSVSCCKFVHVHVPFAGPATTHWGRPCWSYTLIRIRIPPTHSCSVCRGVDLWQAATTHRGYIICVYTLHDLDHDTLQALLYI